MVQKMPIPTRSAPRPPGNFGARNNDAWSNNDLFGSSSTMQPVQKKKPPPRPPPPRFRKDHTGRLEDRTKKPARPTVLLTNLFGKKPHQKNDNNLNAAFSGNRFTNPSTQSNNLADGSVSLIDLSPPGSPTFTTRSSSDGVSVDSFGSDGNSNPSVFTSSGNTSQTESAFEDDFDFFGSLNSGKTTTTTGNDPWKINSTNQDPFSPLPSSSSSNFANSTKRIGDARFFAYNDSAGTSNSKMAFEASVTNVTQTNVTMPTIIRARPPKPPAPKSLHRSLAPTVTDFNAGASSSGMKINASSNESTTMQFSANIATEWPASFERNSSPPMPSIPPPAPPSEYLTQVDDVPTLKQTVERPHGIALYDFAASQNGDLPLKQGERVDLLRVVNEEWLEGRIGNRTGIFPANFVDIVVPLPGNSSSNIVNALYTFTGETWEDLPFEEGSKITVLSRISDDWLYGECGGKKGQFPANYVDRVPQELPKYS